MVCVGGLSVQNASARLTDTDLMAEMFTNGIRLIAMKIPIIRNIAKEIIAQLVLIVVVSLFVSGFAELYVNVN